jgi:hypothetical protein
VVDRLTTISVGVSTVGCLTISTMLGRVPGLVGSAVAVPRVVLYGGFTVYCALVYGGRSYGRTMSAHVVVMVE